MAWTKETNRTPTTVGRLEVTLQDSPAIERGEEVAIISLDEWVALGKAPNAGTAQVADEPDGQLYVEGVDYDINYSVGAIMALSAGSMVAGESYYVSYEHKVQRALYSLVVLDQNGEELRRIRKEALEPHLSAGVKAQLTSFLDDLRATAEAQIL